jgi:hypothetical protein
VGAEQGADMNGAVGLRAKAGRLADVEVCLLSNAQVRQQTFELRRHDTTNLGKCTTPYSGYQTPDPRPLEKMLATYVLQQLDAICADARDAALCSCSIRYRRVNVDLGPTCS